MEGSVRYVRRKMEEEGGGGGGKRKQTREIDALKSESINGVLEGFGGIHP